MNFTLVVQVAALICLLLASLNVPVGSRVSVGWLGMFLWLLSLMLGAPVSLHSTH